MRTQVDSLLNDEIFPRALRHDREVSLLEGTDGSSDGCYPGLCIAHIGITVNRHTGIAPAFPPAYGGISPLSDIHHTRSEDGGLDIGAIAKVRMPYSGFRLHNGLVALGWDIMRALRPSLSSASLSSQLWRF